MILKLASKLAERKENGNFRQLLIFDGNDFTSNDYLSFARDSLLTRRIQDEIQLLAGGTSGLFGSTGSRLLSGNHDYIVELESYLAKFYQAEASLLFSNGYMANMGLLSSLADKHDLYLYDESCHASLKDGIRLSHALAYPFRHNDMSDLEKKVLRFKDNAQTIFIVTESIFSMDGDSPNAAQLIDLAARYEAVIIADEAHASGIRGHGGAGVFAEFRPLYEKIITIHTFGKALGVQGACIAADQILKDFLINFSRHFIYTTAMPLVQAVAVKVAHEYLRENYARLVSELQQKISLFQTGVSDSGKIFDTPIQKILYPGNENARKKAEFLRAHGHHVRAILSPTVRPGSERLRIILHRHNKDDEICHLASLLKVS